MSREAVLVVATDHTLERVLKALSTQGYQLAYVNGVDGALEALAREAFDLVLVDLDTLGQEAYEALRAMQAGHFFYLLALSSLKRLPEVRAVVQRLLLKPFSLRELRASVKDALTSKSRLAENLRQKTLLPLLETGKALLGEMDLGKLFHLIVEIAQAETKGERVSMMLLEGEELRIKAARGLSQEVMEKTRQRVGEGIAGWVVQHAEAVILPEEAERDTYLREAMTQTGVSSALCVPLLARGRVIGVLSASKGEGPPFGRGDLGLLSLMGEQAALAIEKTQLLNDARTTAERIAMLNRITSILNSSLDLETIYKAFAQEIRKLVSFDRLSIALLEEGRDKLRIIALVPEGGTKSPKGTLLKLEKSAPGWVVLHSRPLIRANIRKGREWPMSSRLWDEGMRSSISLPLFSRGRSVGALTLTSREPAHYSEADLGVLEPIAQELSISLENSRLFSEAKERAQNLAFLDEIAGAISSKLDRGAILSAVLKGLSQLLPADRVAFTRYDKAQDTVSIEAVVTEAEESQVKEGNRYPGPHAVGQTMLAHPRPLILPYTSREKSPIRRQLYKEGMRSQLSLPVTLGDTYLGMLSASSRYPRAFGEAHIEVAERVARHLGIALANAQLFEDLRQEQRRVEQLIGEVVLAQEGERKRIAVEIHDSVAQWMVGALYRLQAFKDLLDADSGEVLKELEETVEIIGQSIKELRRAISDLHPPALGQVGLLESLRLSARTFQQETGIPCHFSLRGHLAEPKSSLALGIYRVAQEALNNVRRHAQASEVEMKLSSAPEGVRLLVRDNGRGFDLRGTLGRGIDLNHSGLTGMRHRAELMGGELEIESAPGMGTSVTLFLSAEAPAQVGSAGPKGDAPWSP